MADGVAALNALAPDAARREFLACCHSARWADRMVARRPFGSAGDLYDAAEAVWRELGPPDHLEAFAGHPRIGDVASSSEKYAATAAWAAGEQAGTAAADEATLAALAAGNRDYEARFGHVFIVCATGKSATEMLALLKARLGNDPAAELTAGAGEQAKITRIRLEKLLSGLEPSPARG